MHNEQEHRGRASRYRFRMARGIEHCSGRAIALREIPQPARRAGRD